MITSKHRQNSCNPTFIAGLLAAALMAGVPARGEDAPAAAATNGLALWEVGLAGAGARIPLYRGSDEYRTYAFPMPYVIYRGDILKMDREGIRGLFYRNERIETDVSFGGNPPVTDGAEVRRGMPDLDPVLEAGPALKVFFHRGKRLSSLYIETALRAVMAISPDDLSVRHAGDRLNVSLVAGRYTPSPDSDWSMGGRLGADFGDAKYHGYFYDVTEDQATPDRPAYRSSGGYGGCHAAGYLVRRLSPRVTASVYARWENLDGAVYDDSPLVRTRNNFVLGAAVMWKIKESVRKTEAK